ncbi:hypothetical protein EG346_01980 [Chryseobacterium carnipullorum]|uniref:Uncharacterized protein n=1 Tax=Chryseobacterium carnipullorum TaxID=1124835 RepID=A0A376EFF9_CHRCU|nr:hypothetical protein [Chryseobacterium carnipullorum]AZA47042.1 hypothetical protein EG346_01980 [Chryseobacterium carnipullorum]AZA66390.1 hypothetical protein EG345_18085 [Chryseobacterium carnipullorum]STD07477.1 Uncharacterised protein [Chryseobacterium carnipullorum]
MSADNKKDSFNTAFNDNAEISRISGQKIIDMTNQFYLEMSKNILSEREYEILEKILIDKCPLEILSEKYNVGFASIRKIYENVFYKVKSVSGLIREIDLLKEKINPLSKEFISDFKASSENRPRKTELQNRNITASSFLFSSRLRNMLNKMDIVTFKDLTDIPLTDYPKYRGFKGKCMEEFVQFIEFENLEDEFEGFYEFKKKTAI